MRRQATATRFIEQGLDEYPNSIYPSMQSSWIQATIELAYAQGDIDDGEYVHYYKRLRLMEARSLGVAA